MPQVAMSAANDWLRNPVADSDFGDPDLTPKPLRISKRAQAGASTANVLNASSIIHKSYTQDNLQALAPNKSHPTRTNSTQLDLSLQDIAATNSRWGRRNTFLHVHKQRQSMPINPDTATSTEPIGFSSFNSPARSRNSCPTMGQLESDPDAGNVFAISRPASTRAFTTGIQKWPNSLSPVHESSSSPRVSSALRIGRRRAVTDVEAYSKDLKTLNSLPHQDLRKQCSHKSSLVSRMMIGLTNRAHVSLAASRGRNDVTQTAQDVSASSPSRARKDMHASRQGSLSTGMDTDSGLNHHHAPMPFPTPPISDATSSTTTDSLDSRRSIEPTKIRQLCEPTNPVLLGAELTLTPEYAHVTSGQERNMLVSLDIKGTTNSTSTNQDVWSEHTGLDIVVVIDNSLQTSPAALMASCETARFLASILNSATDRLAILCTSVTDTSSVDPAIIRDLSDVNLKEVKSDLDTITSSTEELRPNSWIDIIHHAKEILLKSTVPDEDEEVLQDTFGHIFLLTPDVNSLPAQSLTHDKLTFHIICPASVPINDQASVHCNGWKLRSLSGKDMQVVSKKKDLDPMSVTNRLRVLISQARSGKLLRDLTDLVLEISAGPDCILEGVIGRVKFSELHLHPGEVFTVLFKLRVCDAAVREYSSRASIPNSNQSSETFLDAKNILSQLDRMLMPTDANILTARLSYKNSILPAGVTCSVTADCHVKRRLADPDHRLSPSKSNALQPEDCTALVEMRLAYHLARQGSPRTALKSLHKEYGDNFEFSACRDYVTLVARELRHQARILERMEINTSPDKKKHRPAVHSANTSNNKNSWETHTRNAVVRSDDENQKPPQLLRATSDIPTEELFETEPALKESREQMKTDEARRIWGDMRKGKMKRPPLDVGRSVSEQSDVREMAVRNKRSLGSETLRSIFSAGESVGKGMGAPWM